MIYRNFKFFLPFTSISCEFAYSLESMLLPRSLDLNSCLHLKTQRTCLTMEDYLKKKERKKIQTV